MTNVPDSPTPARRFEFTEGNSQKFWSVTQDGNALTIRYGRLGAAGQVQEKTFATDAEAAGAGARLIAEKVGKGYREVGTDAAAAVPGTPTVLKSNKPKAAEPAAVSEVVPPAPEALGPAEPRIRLELADWLRATWRDLPPLPKPVAAPFDLQDALARLRRVKPERYGWQWGWADANIAPALTPEEGSFWFTAMRKADMSVSRTKTTPKVVAEQMESEGISGPIQPEQIAQILGNVYGGIRPESVPVLLSRFSLPAMLSTVIAAEQAAYAIATQNMGRHYYRGTAGLREGLRRYVLPYLTPDERQAAQAAIHADLDVTQWPVNHYDAAPLPFYLAALFGLSVELRPIVEGWKDDFYVAPGWDHTHYHRPQDIVFGLGSAAEVEMQMRRLKLKLTSPDDVRAWLAHTEASALDYVKDVIVAETNKDEAAKLTGALALAETPQNAPVMLDLMLNSRAPRPARQWLDDHPAHAIAGLVPVAGVRGRLSEAATEFLRTQKRLGRRDLIEAALANCPADAAARVRADVLDAEESSATPFDDATTPDWLREALTAGGKLKSSAPNADLPPVTVGEHCLNDAQTNALLAALATQKTPQSSPHPLVTVVKSHADAAPCDAFAWRVFERWRAEGAPSKDRWALMGVGLLGGDPSALKLAPLVRAWPGESQHARAVLGLEVLRAIGTDTALMQINGIAQKVPFKGLKASAVECMEGIAADRGLSRAQLEDRIVPDCDLDERGSRTFDFGPRQFKMVLGPDMKPMVRDADGKAKPDLPKPNAKDNAALSEKAIADWKLLKKQVAEVAKVQAARLEQAMVTGRRWSQQEFETLLVRQPLMTNLVRLLVWGVYDEAETLMGTFRVTEDGTYADAQDAGYALPPGATVGVAHPLHLSPDARSAWGELMSDYEIVPPFPQMGRALHALTPDEAASGTDITRFKDTLIPAASVVYGLDKLEWMRGLPADGGGFSEHTKPFYGANVTAVVTYEEGVAVGYIVDAPDQKMTAAFFIPGIVLPHEWWPAHKDRLPLSAIDPVVVSEVLADLNAIAAKAK